LRVSSVRREEVFGDGLTIITDKKRRKPITVARRYTDGEVSCATGI